MIVNFSIQNFGPIRDKQTLSFEATKSTYIEDHYVIPLANNRRLLKLALIYGGNASGKSTILKALIFLRQLATEPLLKKKDKLHFHPFLLDSKTPHQYSTLEIEFMQNSIRYLYKVEFENNGIRNELLHYFTPHKSLVYERTTDSLSQCTKIRFSPKTKTSSLFIRALAADIPTNNTIIGAFLKANLEHPILKPVADWFEHYLCIFDKTNTNWDHLTSTTVFNSELRIDDLILMLNKADFYITNFSAGNVIQKKRLYRHISKADRQKSTTKVFAAYREGKYHLPFELESEGTKKYTQLAWLLAMSIYSSRGILVDELDSSLHPELFMHFILSFLANTVYSQLIVTTHNIDFLNNRDVFREDAIWFTDKSIDCATELYSLANFDRKVVKNIRNVSNAYKTGKLGGKPILGDYFVNLQ